jgi:hypothetical protein
MQIIEQKRVYKFPNASSSQNYIEWTKTTSTTTYEAFKPNILGIKNFRGSQIFPKFFPKYIEWTKTATSSTYEAFKPIILGNLGKSATSSTFGAFKTKNIQIK